MSSIEYVYFLQHSYEYEFEGEEFDEIKAIGIFSTREKAEKVINQLKTLPGFKDYPLDCFHIDKYKIDEIGGWEEGFIKWQDAY